MIRFLTLALALLTVSSTTVLAQPEKMPNLPGTLHPSSLSRYPVIAHTVLAGDDSELFASIKGDPYSQGGVSDPGEIWYSQKVDTGWMFGSSLPYPFNTAYSDVLFSLSPDNNAGLMYGVYVRDVQQQRPGFSMMFRKTDDFWDSIRPLYIKGYYNNLQFYYAQLASDGYTLLLAVQRDDSLGGLDLYVSQFDHSNGYFQEPKSLGEPINTVHMEGSPWLAPDMKTLYFSSNRPGTKGQEDIYVATRLDDTWQRWSEPKRLGDSVNTKYADMGFQVMSDGSGVVRRRVPEAISSGLWIVDAKDIPGPTAASYASGSAVADHDGSSLVHIRSWGRDAQGTLRPLAQTWTYLNQRDWKVLTPAGTIAVSLESDLFPPKIVSPLTSGEAIALDINKGEQQFVGLDFSSEGHENTIISVVSGAQLWEKLHAKPEAAMKVSIPLGLSDKELIRVRQRADRMLNALADAGYSVQSSITTDKTIKREQVAVTLSSPRGAATRK